MAFDFSDYEVLYFNSDIENNKEYLCMINKVTIEKGDFGEYINMILKTPIQRDGKDVYCGRIFSIYQNERLPKEIKELFQTFAINERVDMIRLIGKQIVVTFYPQMNTKTKEYKKDDEGNVYAGWKIIRIISQSSIENQSIQSSQSQDTIICNLCKRAIKRDKFKDHVISNCNLGL